jgi:hypothetical protein
MTAIKFVFGSGWWIAWHAVLLLSLVPLWITLDWMRTMQPGKGPQGGEAVFLFLLLVLMILMGMSFVNGLMWAGIQPWSWVQRYLLVPLGLIVAWVFVFWAIFAMTDMTTGIDVPPRTRLLTWWGLVASFAVLYLANLSVMSAVRDAHAGE